MDATRRGASLVTFTVIVLVIYAPLETWYSLPALWDPFYLVDLIAMLLLAWGASRCRRDPSTRSLAVLTAAYGWGAANAWRALFGRAADLVRDGTSRVGGAEWVFVGVGTIAMIVGLVWSLRLALATKEPVNP